MACDAGLSEVQEVRAEKVGLRLVGVDGRVLGDGAWYAVPRDWGGAHSADASWAICPGQRWREAFAVRNEGAEAVQVALDVDVVRGEAVEWRLIEPARVTVDWQGPRALGPGEVAVFDLLHAPVDAGLREVDLWVTSWGDAGLTVKRVRIAAWCGQERAK
jgi:hypothetical protein